MTCAHTIRHTHTHTHLCTYTKTSIMSLSPHLYLRVCVCVCVFSQFKFIEDIVLGTMSMKDQKSWEQYIHDKVRTHTHTYIHHSYLPTVQ